MKLYKILVNGKSCHGGNLEWSLPTKKNGKWIPGKWHQTDRAEMCEHGLHLTSKPFAWYKWGCTAYEAQTKDKNFEWNEDKCVVKTARLLKEVPHPKWWLSAIDFVNELPKIKWMKPHGMPHYMLICFISVLG